MGEKTLKQKIKDRRKIRVGDPRGISGFTLPELLVAMTAFLLVTSAVVGIFLTGLGGTRRIFGQQNVQDAGRFILESMAKELRMSKISTSNGESSIIDITNSKAQNVVYAFSGTNLTRDIIGDGNSPDQLNPGNTEVTGKFYVQKSGSLQPRVTIVLSLKNKTVKAAEEVRFNLQTTISSRQYE